MAEKEKDPYAYLDPSKPIIISPEVGKSTKLEGDGFVSRAIGNSDFGKSKYDDPTLDSEFIESGDYKFARGEKQNGFAQVGLGVLRAASKAAVEAIKSPAYLYSLGEWAGSNILTGGKGTTLEQSLDNSIINSLEDVEDKYKEVMPVYQSYKSGKGGIMDNIMSTSFWASEGADGVGYLLGMMGPGFAIKGMNMAGKISKLGLGSSTKVGKFIGKNAQNIELGAQTTLNTFIESAAEAKGAIDHAKAQGVTDPETLAKLGREVLFGNMALLLAPNLIMNKALLGRGSVHLDEYRDAAGKLVANRTKKQAISDYAKSVGTGVVSEGFVEEGGQTSIENYEVNKALGKTKDGFIEGVAKEYLNTLSTTEGQKSIVLGAVLGGLGNAFGKYKERAFNDKNQSNITKLINNNYEGYSADNDIYKRNDDGSIAYDENKEPVLDPYKLAEATKNHILEVRDSQLRDLAALDNNKVLHDYIAHSQFARFAIPFIEQGEVGMDILKEKLDDVKDTRDLLDEKGLSEAKGLKFDNAKYIAGLKQKAEQLNEIFNSSKTVIDDLKFINKINESENPEHKAYANDYTRRLLSAVFQETSKQVFIKEKLRELDLEAAKLDSVIFNDLPQNKILADRIVKDQKSLINILEESKENYNAILDEKEHEKAFKDFVDDIESEQADLEDKVEENTPKPPTEKDAHVADEQVKFNEMLTQAYDAKNFETFEPLYKELKSNVLLSKEDRDTLVKRYNELLDFNKKINNEPVDISGDIIPDPEVEDSTVSPDQDIVSEGLKTITLANDEGNQLGLTTDAPELTFGSEKFMALANDIVMMHLFDHEIEYYEAGGKTRWKFKFIRDNTGKPKEDNNSGIDIDALNEVGRDATVTLETVDLTPEQLKYFNPPPDFDGYHIAIKDSRGRLLGFVQQPHTPNQMLSDQEAAEASRQELIAYRKAVIEKLKSGPVTETVVYKGNGNLYTKLDEKGKIDPIVDVIQDTREKDKLNGLTVFAYSGNEEVGIVLPEGSDFDSKDMKRLTDALNEYGKGFTKPGRVFQMVRDLSNKWSVIPVYSSKVNNVTADMIIEKISGYNRDTDLKDIVRELNPFIYTSIDKDGASLQVNNKSGDITFFTDAKSFSLTEIKSNPVRRAAFIDALKTNRQNISIYNINTPSVQANLAKRGALVSNVLLYQNKEYFVQPLIKYSHKALAEPKKDMSVIDELSAEVNQKNTDIAPEKDINKSIEEGKKRFGINDNESLNDDDYDYGASKTKLSGKPVNREAVDKFLKRTLPQFSLADAALVAKVKNNVVDSFGAYKDQLIYLFDSATMGTAYHEAFHGVFRNLLSLEEKIAILDEAAKKYPKPSMSQLMDLQEGLSKEYSIKQLTYLYYEEKLADEFAEFTNKYQDKNFIAKLGRAIIDFFKDIMRFFGIINTTNPNKLNDLFNRINKGDFKLTSVRNTKISDIDIFNRPFEVFNNDFAYSRELREKFNPTERERIVNTISNKFVALYQERAARKAPTPALAIYGEILKVFTDFIAAANPETTNVKDYKLAIRVYENFEALRKEVDKYLSIRGINPNLKDNVEVTSELAENELSERETTDEGSRATKGFGEQTSISGLSSASKRIKMFLSSIPVVDKNTGKVKKDAFGIEQYHNFDEVYYYLESNLTGVYTLEDQLEYMYEELSGARPELITVVEKLGYTFRDGKAIDLMPSNIDPEELEVLRNDFKTNFSKQQLIYTLVKFDTESSSGKSSFKIMESNRKGISYEVDEIWTTNLLNPNRDTIAEHQSNGEVKIFGTDAAKDLLTIWNKNMEADRKGVILDPKSVNKILLKAGIEFSMETIEKALKEENTEFKKNASIVLGWYADPDGEKNDAAGRKAFRSLVQLETTTMLRNYTSSFNDVENKNVYSIQLPSFASKKIAMIIGEPSQYKALRDDLLRDPFYKYSNLLSEFQDTSFRKNDFAMTFLDGLKDERGDGNKFTAMGPKDFMSMQLALFQNNFLNKNKTLKPNISKYMYIIPSDKTMAMIFDLKRYRTDLYKDKAGNTKIKFTSPIVTAFYNVFLQEASRIKHNIDLKNSILANQDYKKLRLLKEHYHMSKANFKKLSKNFILKGKDLDTKDWETIAEMFDGQAFSFQYMPTLNANKYGTNILDNVTAILEKTTGVENIQQDLEIESIRVSTHIAEELTDDYKAILKEAVAKGVIEDTGPSYVSKSIELELPEGTDETAAITNLMANFAANSWLANIEMSSLLNGDPAMYKPDDLQKRTYQSQSMTTNNRFKKASIRTLVIKDHESATDKDTYDTIVDILKAQGLNSDQIEEVAGAYKGGINVTDAQVYITPEFFKEIHIARGTWTPELSEAFEIIEGRKEGKISKELWMQLGGIKPFYYGNRFDKELGIHVYEQVKCAMLPLFKGYVDMNPLLKDKLKQMRKDSIDMLAHESSFKASIGYREDIESDNNPVILELEPDNFGIQVDNPIHGTDEENDSMRQFKMLILGAIDKTKTYRGVQGDQIIDEILDMEAANIIEASEVMFNKLNIKTNHNFADFVKEMVTKRNATSVIEELLTVENGQFSHPLDNGNLSTQIENLICSLITNNVIKQSFPGDARVQASSIGVSKNPKSLKTVYQGFNKSADNRKFNYFTSNADEAKDYGTSVRKVTVDTTDFVAAYSEEEYKLRDEFKKKTGKTFDILDNSTEGLKVQNEYFEFLESKGFKGWDALSTKEGATDNKYLVTFGSSLNLLQQQLKWIKPDGKGAIEYAECIMPAWSKHFFDKDGKLKDVNSIPEKLREMICYRIPTEGLHSMLPIRVVAFLPETMGNFILLPYEVTAQMGADFDFDKLFFINKEFFRSIDNEGNVNLEEYKYITGESEEAISRRYSQYLRYTNKLINDDKEDIVQIPFDEFKQLPVKFQNVKASRNNRIIDNYSKILTSDNNLKLLIKPSGFGKLETIKKLYLDSKQKYPFFSSIAQRDYKSRNHTGIALKGQSALHVSGHSYATLMDLVTPDKSIKFNNDNRSNFSGLYTKDDSLIADELSSIMAAILDDIKKPILESLGINGHTIDTLCTIIRSGYNIETALLFVSQPSVKELSKLLDKNKAKIKEPGQGWYEVSNMINEYSNRLNDQMTIIHDDPTLSHLLEDKEFMNKVNSANGEDTENINDTELIDALKSDIPTRSKRQMSLSDPKELAEFYSFQLRILKNFEEVNEIAKQLTEINKFFSINKQVGPTIEDIIGKQELLEEIKNGKVITGFDINMIDTLAQTWNVHDKALEYFKEYFPYSTPYYMEIKRSLFQKQFGKPLNEIDIENRQFINGFIRYVTDNTFAYFKDSELEYEDLFVTLPKLIDSIQDPNKENEKFGKVPYSYLKKNVFLKNIKASYDENNGVYFIALAGNRYDMMVKENMIEAFYDLYRDPNTRVIAIGLIKHNFVSSGFFSGLNSYSSLISPEILKEIGYSDYRKEIIAALRDKQIIPTQEVKDAIINMLVRNNPKLATKVFDHTMFIEEFGDDFPDEIHTDEFMIDKANRRKDMIFTNGLTPEYIRVYNPASKAKIGYYYNIPGTFKFIRTTSLGKKGFFMEISLRAIPKESFLKTNNFKSIDNPKHSKVDEASENFQEDNKKPALEQGNTEPPTSTPNTDSENNNENKTPPDLENECE